MKYNYVIAFLMMAFTTTAQTNKHEFDLNTVFICIDSATYNQLFDSQIIKDVFITKAISNKTTGDNYNGRYFIGSGATIEFFSPKPGGSFGDELYDCGIEFKTRKIKELAQFAKQARAKNINYKIDTTYTTADGVKQPWYSSLERKSNNLAISLLEYDKLYLHNLGFNETEINTAMTYDEFNKKISGGRAYPKKFNSIKSVTFLINPVDVKELLKTFSLFNLKKVNTNTYSGSNFTVNMIISKSTKKIRLTRLSIELNTSLPNQTVKISKSITFTTHQQQGEIIIDTLNN